MYDRYLVPINIGDTVAINGSGCCYLGKVIGFTKMMVKIKIMFDAWDKTNRTSIKSPGRLIVVDSKFKIPF